jgi:biotin synthase
MSSVDRASELYQLPLFELLFRSHSVHRQFHPPGDIQRCYLLSIKTGGCPENCSYCGQSAHFETGLKREPLLSIDEVVSAARLAKDRGAQRFCMGAAWRQPPAGASFDRVLEMIRQVKALELEVCATLGMLTPAQAHQLKDAGLDAYNHNLDTSPDHYPNIVTTRTYAERVATLHAAREAGLTLCCGGILGLGESVDDRCRLLTVLAAFDPQPESVPINLLVPIEGTPLGSLPSVDPIDWIRTIAVARILMPKSRVRLAAGRAKLSREMQLLAFFAGANSIFIGDKLLTTPNATLSEDEALLAALQ